MPGEEINSFIKVWLLVLTSLCYSHAIAKTVPKGTKRLAVLLPVVCLFLLLPLQLNSPHLGGLTAFFIAWLANFKLLLFALDRGPLNTHLSLPLFIALACLPIKIRQNPSSKTHLNKGISSSSSMTVNYAVKGLLLGIIVWAYDYIDYMHPYVVKLLYCLHIYFFLEIVLAVGAAVVRSFSGLELEPQFNEPFLSTSLQDFWGRRWNLMVTSILRPTVYEPTLRFSSGVIGRKWAPLPSVFSTFLVSGVMHELMFYYLGRMSPTGEMTLFFLIHGFCLAVEIGLKKALRGWWQPPWVVTGPLTVGFVLGTGFWLFIPQFSRCKADARAFEEYAELGAWLKECLGFCWKSKRS
ncbi:acyl-CoA sterol acyl transferase 1, ARABIDOPSIS THALIANA STEROL O-ACYLTRANSFERASE 1 [Hibiscus trionum]|uniref:Acyl-CoA sterol acyl transferase 1, ARABIDOPSIS THALIANA STEROL O-ACYLTRANSFERASE 1 n=1 Tax=Hibiscus trionum TaxID=183268 RepID=A0A9W7IWI0_HIBTR|nr:acyl-CoA sterol acyl transferase 1, ARABIDOPSIS THALIANA STEROL O-ACYLTRANSFERASE 1 [Hibiscus trionum]